MNDPSSADEKKKTVRQAGTLAVASLVNYLGWFAWDQRQYTHPDGYVTGPWENWQRWGFFSVLALLAVYAAKRRIPWLGALTATSVITACSIADEYIGPRYDDYWILGMAVVMPLIFLGFAALVRSTMALDKRYRFLRLDRTPIQKRRQNNE